MRPWWTGLLSAGRRRRRAGQRHTNVSLGRLIVDELRWGARRSLDPVKVVAAVVVAVGVLTALGPLTPGPVLAGSWRLGLAVVLGITAAVLAHGLLQRSPQQVDEDDPLPALRAVLASVALLLGGSIVLAYLLAALTDAGDPTAAGALTAGLAVDRPLLIGAALLATGVLASALGARLRVPGALLFLVLGMVIGDDGLGLIQMSNPGFVQSLGVVALAIILFEGGLTTTPDDLRRGAAPGLVLATVGVAITAGVTAVGAMLLLDLPARIAWLVGAIVASTDAAAVFDLLRRATMPARLAAVLKVESGANDPVAVLLTVGLLSSWQTPPTTSAWIGFGALQLIGGAAVGFGAGWAGVRLFQRVQLGAAGLYPILALAIAGVSYGLAAAIGASGFLATYITGIVLAAELPRHRRALRGFHTALANGVEIGLFLLLGLLVFPSQLPGVALTALGVAALLTLVGRPLATAASLGPLGFSADGIAAVSWLGLRGAVPIVLATLAYSAGIPEANTIFNVVFFIVLTSALLQGTTAVPLLRRLGLAVDDSPATVIADTLPLEGTNLDLIEVTVDDGSPLAGRALRDVPAPADALITAVVRGGEVLVPRGDTEVRAGDMLIITTTDRTAGAGRIEAWARRS